MRISDWSSDVCSSDLGAEPVEAPSRRSSTLRPSRRHFDGLNGSSGQTGNYSCSYYPMKQCLTRHQPATIFMRHGQTAHARFGGEPGDMRREHRVRQTEQRLAAWKWFLAEHVEPRAASTDGRRGGTERVSRGKSRGWQAT